MASKLNVNDLLASLNTHKKTQEEVAPKFVENFLKDKSKKINVMSKKQEEMMRRETNYEMAKEDMDKWIGVVKMNREKESLNFQNKDLVNLNVNFFPSQPINDFHKKLESKLQVMNVESQKAVMKHESAVLEKVDKEEAKRRLIEARRHRSAVFEEEKKRRRISKIKSKLYHKIKKRQKQRNDIKNIDQMTPEQKNEYIEKLTKNRIKERITGRHTTKSKHIQNLLRFNKNERTSVQQSINEINGLRQREMERLNEELVREISDEYDDDNYREEAMKDLEAEIEALENEVDGEDQNKDDKLSDLKFIQNAREKRLAKEKAEAYKLLKKLEKGKNLKEKDVNSEMEDEIDLESEESEEEMEEEEGAYRRTFGKKVQENTEELNPHSTKPKKKNIESQLNNYLLGKEEEGEQQNSKNKMLVEGIDIENLKSKYQPERVPIDLTTLIAENKEIYEGQGNEAMIENLREFQQEKMHEIEEEVNKNEAKNKPLKGWGSWAGPGIQEKKVNPEEELRKKLQKIAEIKQKRKDNTLSHVTINEARNKNLSEYFVRELPRNFSNPDQFDFMQNEPIGPEWNSMNQFKDNIKPKVITKVGQVIAPARLPRKMENGKSK